MAEVSLDRLVETAVGGSTEAWQRLWSVIEPDLWDQVDRPRFASHLAHTEDSRRRIVTAIRTQLASDLHLYLDARRLKPGLSFGRWLRTIAKRIGMSGTANEPVVRRPSARRLTR